MNQNTMPVFTDTERLSFVSIRLDDKKDKLEMTKDILIFLYNNVPSSVILEIFSVFFKFLFYNALSNKNKMQAQFFRFFSYAKADLEVRIVHER